MKNKKIVLNYGGFALLEYLLSYKKKKNTRVLDIGGAFGHHTSIMRKFGFYVDIIDKYEVNAEFNGDFNQYSFNNKYDVIFCSHVIEHQRNQGLFLDKIYDLLKPHGELIISGPKHPAERFVEGHIASTILPIFLQILIYAGFDCRNGKMMSLGGIENSFIVKKAKNYSLEERNETGYRWTEEHKERSPIDLISGFEVRPSGLFLKNCEIFDVLIKKSQLCPDGIERDEYENQKIGLKFSLPKNYTIKGIKFNLCLHQNFFLFDGQENEIANRSTNHIEFVI